MPFNPLTADSFNALNAYGEGVGVLAANKQIAVATSKMKGEFNPHQDYKAGDVVHQGNKFWEFDSGYQPNQNLDPKAHAVGDIVRYNGEYYEALNPRAIGDARPDLVSLGVVLGHLIAAISALELEGKDISD